MKRIIFCVFIAIAFASCGQEQNVFGNNTPSEKWETIQAYIVSGAPVSNERPLPNVLSEQEVLLKATDVLIKEGALDPSYYEYQNNPALLTAKIETPILVFDAFTGVPNSYFLNAVDTDGISLARVTVSSVRDADEASFELGRSISGPNGSFTHLITKREAAELIQKQFPDKAVSEPAAIYNLRLDDSQYSHGVLFWYFTVNDNARSATNAGEEYIFEAFTGGSDRSGGQPNRSAVAALDINLYSSPHLKGYQMVKLDKPLRLFDKLNTARSAGGASFAPSSYPAESVGFTPVELK
jgi:hypothetical protein